MKVLDIFSGIAGMSLGFERAGMTTVAFCERGKIQQGVLRRYWPDVRIFDDVTRTDEIVRGTPDDIDIIAGGDPCPIRSRARSNGDSKHPDLSGYFLALVGQKRPRWVVRENVPAPDDCHFTAALDLLGYRTVIVRADAATITGQSRQRDFIIGTSQAALYCLPRFLSHFEDGAGAYTTSLGTGPVIPALTAHRTRYDSRDCYVWESGGDYGSWTVTSERPLPDSLRAGLLDYLRQHAPKSAEMP